MKKLLLLTVLIGLCFGAANTYDIPKKDTLWIFKKDRLYKLDRLIGEYYYNDYSDYESLAKEQTLVDKKMLIMYEDYKTAKLYIVMDIKTKKYNAIHVDLINTKYKEINKVFFENYEGFEYIGELDYTESKTNFVVDKYITPEGNYMFVKKNLREDKQTIVYISKEYLKISVDTYISKYMKKK